MEESPPSKRACARSSRVWGSEVVTMAQKCRRHGRERCTYSFCKEEERRSSDSGSSYDSTMDTLNTLNIINTAMSYDSGSDCGSSSYDSGSSNCDTGSYS